MASRYNNIADKRLAQIMDAYPSVSDLARKARRRIPNVAWQYLESGTGAEHAMIRNREALDRMTFLPRFVKGKIDANLETELLGKTYAAPFGIAPMGLCGLVWPDMERIFARTAKKRGIPYTLSTVATQTPETIVPEVGDMGWFQLYPPKDPEIRKKMLERAQNAGFHTLIVTADVPTPSRREASRKAGLTVPPKINLKMIWEGATHPWWSFEILRHGLPRLRFVESFSPKKDLKSAANYARFKFRGDLDWDYIRTVKDLWKGPVVLKGLLHPGDAELAMQHGVDAVVVSNHGGRQFDGAPGAIEALPAVVKAVNGKIPVIFDSGIRTGLDVLRAISLGADFVLIGRPYLYGVAALGKHGGEHVTNIFMEDVTNNLKQIGIATPLEIRSTSTS
ncbi:MAG: alpha-hydroxy acid oxidase [Bacteroidota bacterium]